MAVPFRTRCALLAAAAALGLTLAGCAQFPDEHPREWNEQPELDPQAGPEPSYEGEAPPLTEQPPPPPAGDGGQPAEPVGCHDPDPAVQATCLEPVGAVTTMPDGNSALVAERNTGRVLRVQRGAEPVEVARIPVDTSGGGGLTGLTLSPSYAEDELVYAYASTATDNRVLRIAPGEPPEPVLTGIPKGPEHNAGTIDTDGLGALLVATGDAGDPAGAADRSSLAGKVLRIDGLGAPPADNPDPRSAVVASGLAEPGGLCGTADSGDLWVTDRGGPQDALQQVRFGRPLDAPEWTWRDSPGVSGCAADASTVVVALQDARALYTLTPAGDGTFTGEPTQVMDDTYGRFSAATLGSDGLVWAGTANRHEGDPVSSDDRVLRIEPPDGGAAGKD